MRKIILIIMFVLLFPIVAAQQPPFQTSEDLSGELTIIFPKNSAFPYNTAFDLHFHVFNSTGSALTNTSIDYCTIHLYDETNSHLIEENLTFDVIEWEIELNSTYSSRIGDYPYLVFCSGEESGFISGSYEVTYDGNPIEDKTSLIAVAIIMIGAIFVLLFFSSTINTEQEWAQPIKLLINMISLFILLIGSGWILKLLETMQGLNSELYNLARINYIALMFVVVPVLLIFFVMFIKHILEFYTKLKVGERFD